MALARKRSESSPVAARRVVEAVEPGSVTPGLHLARVRSVDGDLVVLEVAGKAMRAERDPALDVAVLETATRSGERVLVEANADGALVVVGALRTRATLGVDRADALEVEAKSLHLRVERFELDASEEAVLASKTARLVLRAAGEIESFAERIVSRASGVHKIVGRVLRLN